MNINIYSQKIANFLSLRLIELTGILFILISSFFLLALISYSPEDPNFIISDRQEIKNLVLMEMVDSLVNFLMSYF